MDKFEADNPLFPHLAEILEFRDYAFKKLEENYMKNLHEIEIFFNENTTGDATPQQIKKRSKKLSKLKEENIEDSAARNDTTGNESVRSARPPRAAKMNLDLKEKGLGGKFRRPSNLDPNSTCNIYIKQEKNDNAFDKTAREKPIRYEAMQVDSVQSTGEDSSVLVLDKQNDVVEIESDNEIKKMPPPSTSSTKRRAPRKKTSQESLNVEVPRPIKCEKISINPNNDVSSVSEKTQTDSQKPLESSTSSKTSKKGKQQKNKIPKPIIVKEEKISLPYVNIESSEKTEQKSGKKSSQSQKSNRRRSSESVYEDAMPPPSEKNKLLSEGQTDNNLFHASNSSNCNNVNVPEISTLLTTDKIAILEKTKSLSNDERMSDKVDSTFISAKGLPMAAHNIAVAMAELTFDKIIPSPGADQATFILEHKANNPNATVTLKKSNDMKDSDATFDVRTNIETNLGETYIQDCIITPNICEEDIKEPPNVLKPKYKPKPKSKMDKNQIFNPYVQSPLKKKIEAFEKVAADAENSTNRQFGTKSKIKQKDHYDENIETKNKIVSALRSTSKNITPTVGRPLGRILTPSQSSSSITPTIGNIIPKMPNSESKAIGIAKSLSSNSKSLLGQQSARSRENSVEDLKRGYLKFQEISERKKQRDEKQQQALIIRQQKEKEREERFRQLLLERQEKKRIAEQKRNLEEIQKNIKLLDEKNEQKRKLEKQKLEKQAAAAAAAKKEREMLENLKIQKAKEKMQQEYFKNQKLAKEKVKESPAYNFEMLHTDDETDDEDNMPKKRPPMPEWATKELRHKALILQSYMPTSIVDSFFPLKPLTPDLREIFPTIDPRYCTRNSSVCWSTPPRYSELPKY